MHEQSQLHQQKKAEILKQAKTNGTKPLKGGRNTLAAIAYANRNKEGGASKALGHSFTSQPINRINGEGTGGEQQFKPEAIRKLEEAAQKTY